MTTNTHSRIIICLPKYAPYILTILLDAKIIRFIRGVTYALPLQSLPFFSKWKCLGQLHV